MTTKELIEKLIEMGGTFVSASRPSIGLQYKVSIEEDSIDFVSCDHDHCDFVSCDLDGLSHNEETFQVTAYGKNEYDTMVKIVFDTFIPAFKANPSIV